jgi:hypothetical protein
MLLWRQEVSKASWRTLPFHIASSRAKWKAFKAMHIHVAPAAPAAHVTQVTYISRVPPVARIAFAGCTVLLILAFLLLVL